MTYFSLGKCKFHKFLQRRPPLWRLRVLSSSSPVSSLFLVPRRRPDGLTGRPVFQSHRNRSWSCWWRSGREKVRFSVDDGLEVSGWRKFQRTERRRWIASLRFYLFSGALRDIWPFSYTPLMFFGQQQNPFYNFLDTRSVTDSGSEFENTFF